MKIGDLRSAGTVLVTEEGVTLQFNGGAALGFIVKGVPSEFQEKNHGRMFTAVMVFQDSLAVFFPDGGYWATGTFDDCEMRGVASSIASSIGYPQEKVGLLKRCLSWLSF